MKISIVSGFEKVNSVQRGDNTYHEQQAYAHLGAAYPVPFKITHSSPNSAYQVGDYQIDPASFRVNQYGSLELDRYNFKLTPIVASASSKAS